jgi:hypothetical protein
MFGNVKQEGDIRYAPSVVYFSTNGAQQSQYFKFPSDLTTVYQALEWSPKNMLLLFFLFSSYGVARFYVSVLSLLASPIHMIDSLMKRPLAWTYS